MMPLLPSLASLILTTAGIGLWATQVPGLHRAGALNHEPNPLDLKRSAYGEVIAMALQGPIDEQWTTGVIGRQVHQNKGEEDDRLEPAGLAANAGLAPRMRGFISELEAIAQLRTNPKSASDAHKREIRRNIENRLRFAYEFDPANFGNYNSYHFFITQPQLGTRPMLTKQALILAEETIAYCATREDDPRPALTAAAAAENILQLMFERPDRSRRQLVKMRHLLEIMDRHLARYRQISARWEAAGTWRELSPMRQAEAEERYQLTERLRAAAEATLLRFESETSPDSASY